MTGRRRCATRVPVNVTVPAVGPSRRTRSCCAAAAGPPRSRSPSPARASPTTRPGSRRCATRSARTAGSGSTSTGCGTSTPPSRASPCSTAPPAAWSTSSSPCASVEDLARVRRAVDVPIAADESIRRADDPYRVRDLEAADVAVLKVQPLGGVRACLRIAEDIGLPVVVSSALETSIGIAAGVALAAALPELPYACGLATVQLLEADVVTESLLPVDGALPVRLPVVDESLLRADAGPGRALGGPAGRGPGAAAGSSLVTATDLRAPSSPRWSRPASPRSWSRPGRATRRSPSRRTTRRRPACSGCTPASTSAPPASWRSG